MIEVTPPTPGWKTTEAQLIAAVTALIAAGVIPAQYVPIIAGLAAFYAACRTILKAIHEAGYAKAIPDLPEILQLPSGSMTTTITQVK